MAKSGSKTPMVIGLIILAFVGIYIVAPQTFSNLNFSTPANQGGGGVQVSPTPQTPAGAQPFIGELTISTVHRDALDNAETRTDATNVVVNYYAKTTSGTYLSKGSSSSDTATLTIDASMDSTLYFTAMPASGQSYFIAPNAIADKNINSRITAFDFVDVTSDGTPEWLFTVDLHDMPAPVAGQTASTIQLTVLSYDDGSSSMSSPADQTSVSSSANTQSWIRWENTVGAETADAVYEVEVRFNTTNSTQWSEGNTIMSIPNTGDVALTSFKKSDDGSSTKYKYTYGNTLENANYITTPQNGNTVHPMPLKVEHSISASGTAEDSLQVTLYVRSKTSAQGNAEESDCVILWTGSGTINKTDGSLNGNCT